MLFKGTAITKGSGEAVVAGTGMSTELGTISSLVHETVDETTPLEKRLNQLGHWLIWVSLGVAALVGVTGIAAGRDVVLMIETGIALAVASIPEGLPYPLLPPLPWPGVSGAWPNVMPWSRNWLPWKHWAQRRSSVLIRPEP